MAQSLSLSEIFLSSCQSEVWKQQTKASYTDSFSGGYVSTSGGCISPTASKTYTLQLESDSIVLANLVTANVESSLGAHDAMAYACIQINWRHCGLNGALNGLGRTNGKSTSCLADLPKDRKSTRLNSS